jgi:deoxyadenosine/deoxycytidine kinase
VGKLITIVGNSGAGKTTLAHLLGTREGFSTGLEVLGERPYQELFKHDSRHALANQVDFCLWRAEQERTIRSGKRAGILDGGLELDYFVFTHLFRLKGYLTNPEFDLLSRLFASLRTFLPSPDLIVYLHAPIDVIIDRFKSRNRSLEIASLEDLPLIQGLLDKWLSATDTTNVLRVDARNNFSLDKDALTVLSKNIWDRLN